METTVSSDLPLSPPTPTQEFSSPAMAAASMGFCWDHYSPQNPKKKRTKLFAVETRIGFETPSTPGISPRHVGVSVSPNKPRPRKPDRNAPKITMPCSECGKRFWSWKALFGHMRCHPERQWRGIYPPPQFRREERMFPQCDIGLGPFMSEKDHEVAACLLMLANGRSSVGCNPSTNRACEVIGVAGNETVDSGENIGREVVMYTGRSGDVGRGNEAVEETEASSLGCRFECSSCRKTFGSHQALGGHRATHKNVKGCFAITKNEMMRMLTEDECENSIRSHESVRLPDTGSSMMLVQGGDHRCSVCPRTSPTGQALGGHMRRHWERFEAPVLATSIAPGSFLDLNLPAPLDDRSPASCSSGLQLELKLGL
ncbi:hypothetical protein Droror1_Dr00006898 [Drosera rotundifolia]